jgi:hypothetical protein
LSNCSFLGHVFEVGHISNLNIEAIESSLEGKVKLLYFDYTSVKVTEPDFQLVSLEMLTCLTDALEESSLMINCGLDEKVMWVCSCDCICSKFIICRCFFDVFLSFFFSFFYFLSFFFTFFFPSVFSYSI